VSLAKADRGEPWPSPFKGQADVAAGDDAGRLMLERFQEEHPGFDFSGAQFSGEAPDPRTFLGGVKRP